LGKTTPQPISDILKNVVEKLSQKKEGKIHKVIACWPKIAGKQLSRHTRPAHIKKGTLIIDVDESAWLYHASLQKENLLKALRKRFKETDIENVQFRIGNTNDCKPANF
jgi:predicted nucleic acid-binding Zn ribbon protein